MGTQIIATAFTAVFLLAASPLAIATYGQLASAPTDITIVEGHTIKDRLGRLLHTLHLKDYTLYENGTAVYVFGTTPNPSKGDITIITTHEYRPEAGYTFDNATGYIITPQGKRLVISNLG